MRGHIYIQKCVYFKCHLHIVSITFMLVTETTFLKKISVNIKNENNCLECVVDW